MNDERPDAALVAAYLVGDRHALAAIYDRYADALYDTAAAMLGDRHEAADVTQDVFLAAAERLGQLRDGARLKAWLFAILRNDVYRRTAKRRRARPTDFSLPAATEMARSSGPVAATASAGADAVEATELAADVRAAARGLDPRDQLVLELVARQELSGTDLAAALGVSVQQSYVLVKRMRERVERSLGALAVARAGRRACAELAVLLAGWDGTFDVQLRKRVARHVDRCTVCAGTQRRVGALALVAAAPALAVPSALRDVALGAATGPVSASPSPSPGPETTEPWTADDDGFPRPQRSADRRLTTLRRVALVAAASIVAVAVVAAVLGSRGDDISSTPAPLPTSAISAPGSATTDGATTSGTATPTVVDAPTASTRPPASTTTTAPPSTTTTTTTNTTNTDPSPPASGPLVLVAATTSTTDADDSTPPVVELVSAPSSLNCPWSAPPFVTARVLDDSTVDDVTLSWDGPATAGETAMMRGSGPTWSGRLDVAQVDGTWDFVIEAVDAAGNTGRESAVVVVTGC